MSDQSNFERLKTTPVTELNLGSASIRRVIKHAGFDTLPKLLDLSEKDIDALFEWRDADVIIELRERYRANPEDFASSVLQKREIDAEAVDETLSKAKASYVAPRKFSASNAGSLLFAHDGPTSLPSMPFSDALRGFEKRAREAFDDLDDRFDDVMVYQTFEEFPTDLDELSDAFLQLFNYYSGQPRSALALIDRHLRNAFAIFVCRQGPKCLQ